jgi:hypothetical protein
VLVFALVLTGACTEKDCPPIPQPTTPPSPSPIERELRAQLDSCVTRIAEKDQLIKEYEMHTANLEATVLQREVPR